MDRAREAQRDAPVFEPDADGADRAGVSKRDKRRCSDAPPLGRVDHGSASALSFRETLSRPRMKSDARSAIISTAAVVLPDGTSGMTDASTTRSAAMPRTHSSGVVTLSASAPMAQVPTAW